MVVNGEAISKAISLGNQDQCISVTVGETKPEFWKKQIQLKNRNY